MPGALTVHPVAPQVTADRSRGGTEDFPARPTWEEVRRALGAANGAVAFAVADRVRQEDLEGAAAFDAACTVVVGSPAEAILGRGSADLAAAIWQSTPGVAALLGDSLVDAGAVVFRAGATAQVGMPDTPRGDALTCLACGIAGAGGPLKAMLVPGESHAALPIDPPALVPAGVPRERRWLADLIESLAPVQFLGGAPASSDAEAVRAGLLLWHDFLAESHAVSQSIEGEGRHRAGDYWHAIMHRREPDYGNAKYWLRRVGRHPIHESLASRAERITQGSPAADPLIRRICPGGKWDPFAFVDACEESASSADRETGLLLRRFQADEILLLLWQTCQDARG